MLKVKCYGGPAHGREVDLDALTAQQSRRFEIPIEPIVDRLRYTPWPLDLRIPPQPRITTNTYYLQIYEQVGHTRIGAVVHRQLQIALLEGADLLTRELHDLQYAMDDQPWTWSEDPSILYQFDEWIEKALHDLNWERVIAHY